MKKITTILLSILLIGALLNAGCTQVLSTPPAEDTEPTLPYIGGGNEGGLGVEYEMKPFTLNDGAVLVITPSAIVMKDAKGNVEAFPASKIGAFTGDTTTTLVFGDGKHRLDLKVNASGKLTKVLYEGNLNKNKSEDATIGDTYVLPADMLTAVTDAVTSDYAATH